VAHLVVEHAFVDLILLVVFALQRTVFQPLFQGLDGLVAQSGLFDQPFVVPHLLFQFCFGGVEAVAQVLYFQFCGFEFLLELRVVASLGWFGVSAGLDVGAGV
jgi:hypothetical protein